MSMNIDIQTGRKKDVEKLLKAAAEFWGNCPNERLSIQLKITALE